MTSKLKLEKWQRVDKAFPNEPVIDWSKVKLCEFVPKHKPRILSPSPFKVEQIRDKTFYLKEAVKELEEKD